MFERPSLFVFLDEAYFADSIICPELVLFIPPYSLNTVLFMFPALYVLCYERLYLINISLDVSYFLDYAVFLIEVLVGFSDMTNWLFYEDIRVDLSLLMAAALVGSKSECGSTWLDICFLTLDWTVALVVLESGVFPLDRPAPRALIFYLLVCEEEGSCL